MSNGLPFTPNTEQTAIAIAYRNHKMIADDVCPRVPVGAAKFEYSVFDLAERLTVPDTLIGRKSEPNQVEFTKSEQTAKTEDHGLSDVVPNNDIKQAPPHYDPLNHATEGVTDLVMLARELRVAKLYTDPANYAHNHDLSGADFKYLDDPNNDVLQFLQELMDDMLVAPNTMVLQRKTATKLRSNKHVIKAYNGSLGDSGLVPMAFIQDTLGIDKIHIGEAMVNGAKKGENPKFERAWGNALSLTYIDPLASTKNNRMTFAMTAQYGERVSSRRDVSAGLDGGIEVLVGERVRELAIAKEYGMLLTNLFTPA
ncbi:hypothetical protein [Pseudoalteromonas sp. R3]|uniref:hypothetical protein n=1 Tax=Pseudoalteromonas sp. R3 TaxID=1709477 RepID=UPI0006B5E1F3|nr:hypothetical protein [Pseudoalteromonas sp. R3]AZZ98258.1 capsid protein [Pseudoalteromonas sp. R3]